MQKERLTDWDETVLTRIEHRIKVILLVAGIALITGDIALGAVSDANIDNESKKISPSIDLIDKDYRLKNIGWGIAGIGTALFLVDMFVNKKTIAKKLKLKSE